MTMSFMSASFYLILLGVVGDHMKCGLVRDLVDLATKGVCGLR